jgi:hypothetical protein
MSATKGRTESCGAKIVGIRQRGETSFEFILVAELTHRVDQTTPPLCSAPITDASTLVPVAPSLTGASIFLLVVLPLVVSLRIAHQLHVFRSGA